MSKLLLTAFAVIFLECPAGTYGVNCSATCPDTYFGRFCEEECHCSYSQYCDPVIGCLNITTNTTKKTGDNLVN